MPRVGTSVTILFLDARLGGVIERVLEDGRRIEVLAEDGEVLVFELNRATARFVAVGAHAGARLVFDSA
jgi:hypothetical protein